MTITIKSGLMRYYDAWQSKKEFEQQSPLIARVMPAQVGWRVVVIVR